MTVRILSPGTATPSRRVVIDWVARIPRVSQSSTMEYPGSSRWTRPNTDLGPSSRSARPKTSRRVHAGDSEVKIFVPSNEYPPPGAGDAFVVEPKSTRSLPGSEMPKPKTSPAAASRRICSPRGFPCATRKRPSPTMIWCMLIPRAVPGAAAARRVCSAAIAVRPRPDPPNSAGTNAPRYPAPRRSARSAAGKELVASTSPARERMRARRSSERKCISGPFGGSAARPGAPGPPPLYPAGPRAPDATPHKGADGVRARPVIGYVKDCE